MASRVRGCLLCLAVAAGSAGCAVGPDFKVPPAPDTRTFVADPQPAVTVAAPGIAGTAQVFAVGRELSSEWWTLFQSADLDRLIQSAVRDSPSVAAAQATLREARANLRAEWTGQLLPAGSVGAGATRQRLSPGALGIPAAVGGTAELFSVYNASVNVSYAPDLFGAARRRVEGARAAVDLQRDELLATYLALTTNLVTTAVHEASLRAQIAATREILDAETQQLDLTQRQLQIGAVARAAWLALQTQVMDTRASLPPLELQLEQSRHRLAVLAGRLPNASDLPEFTLADLQLPATVPVSLPSALVHQRPDILAAEATLHEAAAALGVATADLYPQLTLTAGAGFESLAAGGLFGSANSVWNVGGALLQPLLSAPQLAARRRAAVAAYEAAAALYRQTVLQAFQEVADTLRALEFDAAALAAEADAAAAAAASLSLSTRQYAIGAVSHLALLDAERADAQARLRLAAAQATRFADTAALFQALGGGWWRE